MTPNFPKDPDRDYSISNMEMMIQARLNKAGYFLDTQHTFILQCKNVDFFDVNTNFVAEIDGEQIHANRTQKDNELRNRIRELYGCTLREYSYHAPPTKTRADEITAEIIDNIVGLRKMRQ